MLNYQINIKYKYYFQSNKHFSKVDKLLHLYMGKDITCLIGDRNLFDLNNFSIDSKKFFLNYTNFV